MKLYEAFNRLRWRFSPDENGIIKTMTPNKTDIDAFNEIGKYFELHQKQTIQDNLLFAKLYAYLLSELTRHYTDIDFANEQINKILSEPIDVRIEWLVYKLKDMEYRNYFNRKNVLDPFLKTKTATELEEIHERYKDTIPDLNPLEFLKCGNNWDKESVIYQLENQINLSIQNFKNNV